MAGTDTSAAHKLTFITMTGMVVGSMVGAGVFSLPAASRTSTPRSR